MVQKTPNVGELVTLKHTLVVLLCIPCITSINLSFCTIRRFYVYYLILGIVD
jgi:hypothetical protein